MRQLTKEFFKVSSIAQNEDTIHVMDYLGNPNSVQRMIEATKEGIPPLAAIVAELEINLKILKIFL